MKYTDLTVDVTKIDNGWRAPETVREMACESWMAKLDEAGLKPIAGQETDHENEDGTWTLAWIVGTDERYYYATLNAAGTAVVTFDKGPARKQAAE